MINHFDGFHFFQNFAIILVGDHFGQNKTWFRLLRSLPLVSGVLGSDRMWSFQWMGNWTKFWLKRSLILTWVHQREKFGCVCHYKREFTNAKQWCVKIFSSLNFCAPLFSFLKGICFPVPLCVNMQMPPISHLSLKHRFQCWTSLFNLTFTSDEDIMFSNVVISTWIGIL